MTSYCQRDPLWANVTIGTTKQTIGRVGCLITAMSDLSSFFGQGLTPYVLMRMCTFNSDAQLIWQSADFHDFMFTRRESEYSLERVAAAVKDIDLGVVLEVDGGAHWVTPIHWNLKMDCWDICDPWFGDIVPVKTRYPLITGAAFFRRKTLLDN